QPFLPHPPLHSFPTRRSSDLPHPQKQNLVVYTKVWTHLSARQLCGTSGPPQRSPAALLCHRSTWKRGRTDLSHLPFQRGRASHLPRARAYVAQPSEHICLQPILRCILRGILLFQVSNALSFSTILRTRQLMMCV